MFKQSAKALAKRAAQRAGVLEQLRLAYYELRTKDRRRNYRDDRNLRVLMAGVVRCDTNCIDIGANRGSITEEILRLAPDGRHMAIEPVPPLAADLRRRFPSVAVHEAALSDHVGTETFYYAVSEPALSGLRLRPWRADEEYREIQVEVTTLDTLVPDDFDPGFVKVDVEGAQVVALRGASRVLAAGPVIWIEHALHAAELFGTQTASADLWDVLEPHGYRLFNADGDGPLTRDEFLATDDDQWMWTFVAVPARDETG